MIDSDGYRANVGIIISDSRGRVLWARRYGQDSWQFPQGGIHSGESAEQAMYRELKEEIGLSENDVHILGCSKGWLRYRLPKRMVRHDCMPVCIGQKQKWFLLQLTGDENRVQLDVTNHPEFDDWKWVSYWYPLREVVSFKHDVYRKALRELVHLLHQSMDKEKHDSRNRTYNRKQKNRNQRT